MGTVYGKSLYQSNKTYKAYQGTTKEEWLQIRDALHGIGGSDASTALGMNPWRTNEDLWLIKTGKKKQPDISANEQVQYGTEAEEFLRELYRLDHPKYEVEYLPNAILQNIDKPFMLYSPDGLLIEKKTGRKGILEIKTTTIMKSYDKEKWNEQIPNNYYIQVLHGLNVTGFDFIELCAQLKWDDDYAQRRTYHFERADIQDDLEYVQKEVEAFWQSVINKRKPDLILPEI